MTIIFLIRTETSFCLFLFSLSSFVVADCLVLMEMNWYENERLNARMKDSFNEPLFGFLEYRFMYKS